MKNIENNFVKIEHDILEFWQKNNCFSKLNEKNKNGKPFRFIDGPITANNAMGIHHAWGRSVKDIFLRYKAMNGFSCHFRNGFDAQGLWVEVEVEKELGFKDKKDIENYGMANFTRKCVERIKKYSGIITEQSKRLGQWMDWENSYFTHTDENNTAIWHFLKVCNDNGWLAQSHRPMPWCPRCGTSLSEHEMAGSHTEVTHTAVFARVPVLEQNYDILVWTTTPWTLSANTALAVNPELEYAVVELPNNKRPLVLAKNALGVIDGERKILKFIKGEELTGLSYETFLPRLPVQKDLTHYIVAWDEVTADEGSGIVHIAPGCGAEDFELGKRENLAEICPVDESGRFTGEYDFLSGKTASEAAPYIFDALEKQSKLYKTHEYTHSYPVCWRCKTEVLFRLVGSWIIKTDEIRPRLLSAADTVKWEPLFAGKRMQDWLTNMGDWNISRKRFYGLPLPFYPCEKCGHLTVIGSKEELRERSGENVDKLPELHRPWIDEIKINCPKCGEKVSRVPEVGDVWLDAGIVPFSTLGYFENKKEWEKWFPAEWVIEMNEQIRLWFYSMLFMSVTLTGNAPYEYVMAYGSVVQEDGSKFSKSGFMIRFDDAAEKTGADTVRYLYAGANTASDVRFGYYLCDEARRKLLGFWNIYTFFMIYADIDNPVTDSAKIINSAGETTENLMDIWLENRMNDFITKAAKSYENYNTAELIREFEICVDDVSNWYVRLCRKRFWKESVDEDKQKAYNALYRTVKLFCQVMAPVIPFMTEQIWQTMILRFGSGEASVHLSDFPKPQLQTDNNILREVETVRKIIAGGMKIRNESQIKVRQPLSTLYIDLSFETVCKKYSEQIKEEINVKELVFISDWNILCDEYLTLNFKTAGRTLKGDLNKIKEIIEKLPESAMLSYVEKIKSGGEVVIDGYTLTADMFIVEIRDKSGIKRLTDEMPLAMCIDITQELKDEGCYRELLRNCQVLRKEAGFEIADRINLNFTADSAYLVDIIKKYKMSIERETLAVICEFTEISAQKTIDIDGDKVIIEIGK